jgi:plastocyanin
MNRLVSKITIAALLSGFSFSALAGETKDTGSSGAGQNKIEIKDFAFNPQTITVKSGEKITWINRDEEPHTVVSVGKQFKKSTALDTIKPTPSWRALPALTATFVRFTRK